MWLRLVQSARDRDEQNLEAYVKNGQLFYRSLRRIEKDEELLVWYGKDLIELLLLGSSRNHVKSKGTIQGNVLAFITLFIGQQVKKKKKLFKALIICNH